MREIVLDTETTGFKPEDGHRVIEIGCVELVNHLTRLTDNASAELRWDTERNLARL